MSTTGNWTYDASLIGTSSTVAGLMAVRDLIGDIYMKDQLLLDAEVAVAVAAYSNVYLGAAECCRKIAARYSRQVDLVEGDLQTSYSRRMKAYMEMAEDYQFRGMANGAGAMPYVGGVSVADKALQVADADRVKPQFNIGMNDNLLPTAPVGNQTPGNSADGEP